jgi:hypothetical protein
MHFDKPLEGNLYIKFTKQGDDNMQLKKQSKNKIFMIKIKNRNTCASALIQ